MKKHIKSVKKRQKYVKNCRFYEKFNINNSKREKELLGKMVVLFLFFGAKKYEDDCD